MSAWGSAKLLDEKVFGGSHWDDNAWQSEPVRMQHAQVLAALVQLTNTFYENISLASP